MLPGSRESEIVSLGTKSHMFFGVKVKNLGFRNTCIHKFSKKFLFFVDLVLDFCFLSGFVRKELCRHKNCLEFQFAKMQLLGRDIYLMFLSKG